MRTMDSSPTRTGPIYDPKTFDPKHGIGRLISRVKVELHDAMEKDLEAFDISAAQFVILMRLATGEADSASGLCKGISYDPGAMTRMIDRLEQKGLVRRTPLPYDRRKVGLELTAEGKAVYPKLRAASAALHNRFLRGFTRNEVKQLETLLLKILANA